MKISKSVYLLLAGVTLGFATNFRDPFNVPKFILLILLASYLIQKIPFTFFLFKEKVFIVSLVFFTSGLLISTFSSSSLLISIFGDTQRRNGLLTYLALIILMLYLKSYFRYRNLNEFYVFVMILSLIAGIYGVAQAANLDFIRWTKSAGIISTFGNSNFAGAVFVIFSLFLVIATMEFRNIYLKVLSFLTLLINLYALTKTNARQAVLSLIIGIFCIVLSQIYLMWGKKALIVISSFSTPILVMITLGIFNLGPFGPYLYKESIKIRIFYWKAAIKMFFDRPFTGVGLDRYGGYFKQFRDQEYSLRYGFDITSSNAHNVPLQYFATGGILLGLGYLSLVGFVFFRIIKSSSNFNNSDKKNIFNLGAVFISYNVLSFFTIENIAIVIWGWSLMGLILGLTETQSESPKSNSKTNYFTKLKNVLVSYVVLFICLLISIFLIRAETQTSQLALGFNPSNQESYSGYKVLASETLKNPILDVAYETNIAGNLLDYKDYEFGFQTITNVLRKDDRNLQAYWVLATYWELKENYDEAIKTRLKLNNLDPWNARNQLILAMDFKLIGNTEKAKIYLYKILSYASSTDIGNAAKVELDKMAQ